MARNYHNPLKTPPRVELVSTDDEAHEICVSINDTRYTYILQDGYEIGVETFRQMLKKTPGGALAWLKRRAGPNWRKN